MIHLERILLPVLLLQQNLPITIEVPTPPLSPKQTIPLYVPIVTPPVTTQATTLPPPPPITSIPFSTIPLSSPIIIESTTTTIPKPIVEVNVSDTGATTATETPIITKPHSPTNSTDSGATLGGEDEDFDSIYFSPYMLPTDDDVDVPVTSQHLQGINDKLDRLLEDSKAYGGVVLKAFLEIAIEQYTQAIDKSTKAVDESTSTCKKATTEVTEVVHTTHIFLDSLKAHADTNAAKLQSSVDSFSKSLHDESTKFEAV